MAPARRLLLPLSLPLLLVLAGGGCRQRAAPPLDGPDVFFNRDRLARILSVELVDREAVLKEYVGLQIAARMEITGAAELAGAMAAAKGARYAVQGRAADLYERVDVLYTVYFDDPAVLVHRVAEPVEVSASVREASWETGAGGQALSVAATGRAIRPLER